MDNIDWSQYCVVRINEYENMRAEIERLRRLGDAIVRLVRTDDEDLWVACYEWLEARRG